MSWLKRVLAPVAGIILGALIANGIFFSFIDVSVSNATGGFLDRLWENVEANLRVAAIVGCVGGAIGLVIGIFAAIAGD